VVTQSLDLEQFTVDAIAELAQVRQVLDALVDIEVLGVV
jgi:hypothetical protein